MLHIVIFTSAERNETEKAYFKLDRLTRRRLDFRAPRSNDDKRATDGSDGEKVANFHRIRRCIFEELSIGNRVNRGNRDFTRPRKLPDSATFDDP